MSKPNLQHNPPVCSSSDCFINSMDGLITEIDSNVCMLFSNVHVVVLISLLHGAVSTSRPQTHS